MSDDRELCFLGDVHVDSKCPATNCIGSPSQTVERRQDAPRIEHGNDERQQQRNEQHPTDVSQDGRHRRHHYFTR